MKIWKKSYFLTKFRVILEEVETMRIPDILENL